ncbi:myotubularin-related protein 14 [Harpegnathos saltator]|uniref:myotubularin-related protein 14 n=1 Tax=Harpegnathos saltator TaxID=610380 RepID=UPI00058D90AF|nr:myotubularin-related protein 14 [Harpegnathos saltator]XP_011147301.1 myotubularin-related protein 14 [Harpegnathos saltator]XP_025159658.1 myotubularin-related protein 14 [Harpegnathos saltator]
MSDITVQDLQELVEHFSKTTYRTREADRTSQAVMQRCLLLTGLDYNYFTVDNSNGDLCAHYPSHLIIFRNDKCRPIICSNSRSMLSIKGNIGDNIVYSMYDPNKLKKLMIDARNARCRSRFPVPVIFYEGKHVCRSATLSGGPEIYGRAGLDYFFGGDDDHHSVHERIKRMDKPLPWREDYMGQSMFTDWQLLDRVRSQDIRLLRALMVDTIIDFMVEKKKVKYGMNVTSSEKVDKENRYRHFTLVSLPYPGCEFFKEFREHDYLPKGLVFDWYQNYVDAPISVPEDSISNQLRISWDLYTTWDLVKLTQNYLRLILRYLSDSNDGILIHCISGWDRTPLFISLLRISLWADGVIHHTLNSYQLLYYTIAYDWMLFGHNLEDRLNKGEEIFFFCFYFLKHIYNDKFSIHKHPDSVKHNDSQPDNFVIGSESFEILNPNVSPNSSTSSDNQTSADSEPPAVFHVESPVESQDDSEDNGNTIPGKLKTSPKKEVNIAGGSRPSLSASRTSPVGVPIPCNPGLRQRNDSTSSTGSWQLVSGTGSLCGSTTVNAPPIDTVWSIDSDCKPHCKTCTLGYRISPSVNGRGSSAENIDEVIQVRKERLKCLRSIFYKIYPHIGFRMKE